MEVPDGYQIVKYWHNGETTCEFAICHLCHAGLLAEFSQESRRRLEEFHTEHFSAKRGSERCAICGCLEDEITETEFSRTAFIKGTRLDLEILVCGGCTRQMQELMSEETRRVWDRFLEENFPVAPADVLLEPSLLLNTL